jgi:hypothetical protein
MLRGAAASSCPSKASEVSGLRFQNSCLGIAIQDYRLGLEHTRRKRSAGAASPPSTGLEVSTPGRSAAPAAAGGAAMGVAAVGGLATRASLFGFWIGGFGIKCSGGWRCHEAGGCRQKGVGVGLQALAMSVWAPPVAQKEWGGTSAPGHECEISNATFRGQTCFVVHMRHDCA